MSFMGCPPDEPDAEPPQVRRMFPRGAVMSWIDRMDTAQFRGVEFLTESHTERGGRRLAINELPGGEVPVVKDLGGKAWNWRLNAYFIGEDYDLEADEFTDKLTDPGADWLVHPWLGRMWVRVEDFTREENNQHGGMATVQIVFAPGGEDEPEVKVDQSDAAAASIEGVKDAAIGGFSLKDMSAHGMTGVLAAVQSKLNVIRTAIALASLPLTWANQIINLAQGVKGDISALLAMPQKYANALRSLSNVLGGGAASSATSSATAATVAIAAASTAAADDGTLASTARPAVVAKLAKLATTLAQPAKLTGDAALDVAAAQNLQAEAALSSSLVLAAAAQAALADYDAAADRDAVVATLTTAIDTLLPAMPDAVFQATLTMRTAVAAALMAQDLKPAVTRDVARALPSVVLAHRLQIDEAVLIARNRVRHPLFVKGQVDA